MYGLFIEGARWDRTAQVLGEQHPKVLTDTLPTMRLVPLEKNKKEKKPIYHRCGHCLRSLSLSSISLPSISVLSLSLCLSIYQFHQCRPTIPLHLSTVLCCAHCVAARCTRRLLAVACSRQQDTLQTMSWLWICLQTSHRSTGSTAAALCSACLTTRPPPCNEPTLIVIANIIVLSRVPASEP